MHLQSEIIVSQNIEQASKFFYEPSNLSKWDRSVAEVILPSHSPAVAGNTFGTIAPSGMKMSYRIIEFEYVKNAKILLTESRMFKEAIWQFLFNAVAEGTKITCHIFSSLG
jgi:hypothetical protein